jgi:hypothetical protein
MKTVLCATIDEHCHRPTLLSVRYDNFDADEVVNVHTTPAHRCVLRTGRVPSRRGIHRYSGFRTRNP